MFSKLIKVNGRSVVVPSSFKFRKLKDGQFLVEYNERSHYITGGKSAGGRSNEWYLDGFGGDPINCTSICDAIHVILHS